MITENHPCDPDTKERFSVMDRITVKNYYAKMADILKFRKFRNNCHKLNKFLLNTICKCCKKQK